MRRLVLFLCAFVFLLGVALVNWSFGQCADGRCDVRRHPVRTAAKAAGAVAEKAVKTSAKTAIKHRPRLLHRRRSGC